MKKLSLLAGLSAILAVTAPVGAWADCKSDQAHVKSVVHEYTQKVKSGTYVNPVNYGSTIAQLIGQMEEKGCHAEVDALEPFLEREFSPY